MQKTPKFVFISIESIPEIYNLTNGYILHRKNTLAAGLIFYTVYGAFAMKIYSVYYKIINKRRSCLFVRHKAINQTVSHLQAFYKKERKNRNHKYDAYLNTNSDTCCSFFILFSFVLFCFACFC